jgi:curved DNA-binding protein CbpA
MHHPAPQKAHDYFTECCDMLGIDESQPLSSELIKSAYKRAAVRAHPDRGGNAALFDAVTRASAYLQKIVDRVAGIRRQAEMTSAHVPNTQEQIDYLGSQRSAAVQQLQDRPPVALSPKNLDMSMFNQLFEDNKLPDPEKDDGYGDWLKSTGQNDTNRENSTLKKKFALDTFNKTFEQEAGPTNQRSYVPSAIILQPTMGITLGGEKPADYTSPYGGRGVQFTDLKSAYTTDSTFSQNVADAAASIGSRPKNLKEYERERAVTDLSPEQKRQVLQYEQQLKAQEDARVRRAAQQDVMAQRYHEQMQRKLLVEK